MTKYITTIVRIGCNICDSPKIFWTDSLNEFHLCEKCKKNTGTNV